MLRQREAMIEQQLVPRGIHDQRVLDAMAQVARERFMPESSRGLAYYDGPVPLGHGQTISQPYIVALMLQLLELEPTHRVLEIGAGMGYQAAVLGTMVRQVHTLEIIEPLATIAAKNLAAEGLDNVTVHNRDGHGGLPQRAPFHAIIAAAAPDEVPPALKRQLAVGGRLVIPVGRRWSVQDLQVIHRTEQGFEEHHALSVRFVPMTGGVTPR